MKDIDELQGGPLWTRPWLRTVILTVSLPGIVLVALVVSGTPRAKEVSSATGPAASVPVAQPPLLASVPAETAGLQIAAGMAGASAWSLWAKISPLATSDSGQPTGSQGPTFGPGLAMSVVTSQATGGSAEDPRAMDSLVWLTYGPEPGFPAEVIYGVTSTPAVKVRITFSGPTTPLIATAYPNPGFPGLRFYAVAAPPSDAGRRIVAEAFGADGAGLVRTSSSLPPPLSGTSASGPDTTG